MYDDNNAEVLLIINESVFSKALDQEHDDISVGQYTMMQQFMCLHT